MSVESGALREVPYTFSTRFESEPGTNPEEMVGAAHAGCFSMFLSGQLTKAGTPPERIETQAVVTMEKQEIGFTITAVHLETAVKAPGLTNDALQTAVEASRTGCPISRVLKAKITASGRLRA